MTAKPYWDKNKSISNTIFNFLCIALIASVFFTNLMHLRQSGTKLQLTEIIFLLTIPFIPYKKLIDHHLKRNRTFILIVLVYLTLDMLSSVLSHQLSAILESMGRFYLFGLFAILNYWFSNFSKNDLLIKLTKIFIICTVGIVVFAIIGYIMAFKRGWSPYIFNATDYPYFGSLYRLKGPTIYPSMLISNLIFLLLFITGVWKDSLMRKTLSTVFVLLWICVILTFSKSILLLIAAMLVFIFKYKGRLSKTSLISIIALLAIPMIFLTHVIVLKKGSNEIENLKSTAFSTNRIVYETDNYVLIEASYLATKRADIAIARDNLFFGVGTGNFNDRLWQYKERLGIPPRLGHFDPHSTYLGAFAENGLFAGIILLVVLGFVFNEFIKRKDLLTDNFLLALFLIYLFFLIDGISTDILNFRHLWLFFALALTYLQINKPVNSKSIIEINN
ncbi:MAG: O-antigen ligase family protein [Mucilaginibacter sp.]